MTNSLEEIIFNNVVTTLLTGLQDKETIYSTFLAILFSTPKTSLSFLRFRTNDRLPSQNNNHP